MVIVISQLILICLKLILNNNINLFNTNFNLKHYFQSWVRGYLRARVLWLLCHLIMTTQSLLGPASLGGIPSFIPGIQGGLTPLADSTGGHTAQAGPADYSSLSLAQPFVQGLACHPSQTKSSGDFFPGKPRKRSSLYWD